MKKQSFKEFKAEVIEGFEMMVDEGCYDTEELEQLIQCDSYAKLANTLIEFEYWEVEDAYEYARECEPR